ncbi:MAG: hypothetical protein H0W09_08330 [Solirubrobacterales bacterium]|nr:hypothetical protein [Solirubrobacterales bacterium]
MNTSTAGRLFDAADRVVTDGAAQVGVALMLLLSDLSREVPRDQGTEEKLEGQPYALP